MRGAFCNMRLGYSLYYSPSFFFLDPSHTLSLTALLIRPCQGPRRRPPVRGAAARPWSRRPSVEPPPARGEGAAAARGEGAVTAAASRAALAKVLAALAKVLAAAGGTLPPTSVSGSREGSTTILIYVSHAQLKHQAKQVIFCVFTFLHSLHSSPN